MYSVSSQARAKIKRHQEAMDKARETRKEFQLNRAELDSAIEVLTEFIDSYQRQIEVIISNEMTGVGPVRVDLIEKAIWGLQKAITDSLKKETTND